MDLRKPGVVVAVLLATGAFSLASGQDDAPRSGQAVFEAACAKCHTGGIAGFFSRAPALGDEKDWQALAPKGVDGLTATTIAGIGKMVARGGCDTCSDAEIRAAVAYMLDESR